MGHRSKALLFFLLCTTIVYSAERIVECRAIVGGMRECIPYSNKLFRAKEINYQENKKKLIVDRNLPVPNKKPHLKVISVEEMTERYVKVEPSKRFSGSGDKNLIEIFKYPKKIREKPKSETEPIVKIVETNETAPIVPKPAPKGFYKVQKGDTLSKIALMFGLTSKELMRINAIDNKDRLKIGQKIILSFSQETIDTIASATYKVKEGDTLISIAKQFGLAPKAIASYNKIKTSAEIRVGKALKLPLPYVLAEEKARQKALKAKRKSYKSRFIRGFGKHRLRVTATAYTSHSKQTDKTPFLAAWNNRLRPGMKVIAVSRDLLSKYGMRNGTKVKISGLRGIYRVRDKMNKRYKRRIDIYMGTNRRRALRWGRRSVVIYW